MTQTIEATENTWNSIVKGDGLILVDFWEPWCGWCRELAPIFEQLASAYEGRVRSVKVNVDEELENCAVLRDPIASHSRLLR